MAQILHSWENPEQDYAQILAKRRSERRYRSLQLAKTLKILLTKFKSLNVEKFNSEILQWIENLEAMLNISMTRIFRQQKNLFQGCNVN